MPINVSIVALIAVAIVFMIYRQFARRPVVESRRTLVIAFALVGWGLISLSHIPVAGPSGLAVAAAGLAAGVILGVVRGSSMRIWLGDDGITWQRGTVALALLWVASIVVRVGLGLFAGRLGVPQSASFAELPLFFGATLAAQNAYVLAKVRDRWATGELRTEPSGPNASRQRVSDLAHAGGRVGDGVDGP
jgi:hypothetical protein